MRMIKVRLKNFDICSGKTNQSKNEEDENEDDQSPTEKL